MRENTFYCRKNYLDYDSGCSFPSQTIEDLFQALWDLNYNGYCNHISKRGLYPIISAEAFGIFKIEYEDRWGNKHEYRGQILYANHHTLYIGGDTISMHTLEDYGFLIKVLC